MALPLTCFSSVLCFLASLARFSASLRRRMRLRSARVSLPLFSRRRGAPEPSPPAPADREAHPTDTPRRRIPPPMISRCRTGKPGGGACMHASSVLLTVALLLPLLPVLFVVVVLVVGREQQVQRLLRHGGQRLPCLLQRLEASLLHRQGLREQQRQHHEEVEEASGSVSQPPTTSHSGAAGLIALAACLLLLLTLSSICFLWSSGGL